MKKLFIIANWKSYKTRAEAQSWLDQMADGNLAPDANKEVIVCPSFHFLADMHKAIQEKQLTLKLGVQDISPFDEGSYTGAISAKQAAEFVTHAIVGHSERRKYFHETNDDVLLKIPRLLDKNITPILCISDLQQLDYFLSKGEVITSNAAKIIFVYEPPSAISGGGTFHAESPENANTNAAEISKKIGKRVITLYGGSVNPDNAAQLFAAEYIDGGLIGQASLDAGKFRQIIEA